MYSSKLKLRKIKVISSNGLSDHDALYAEIRDMNLFIELILVSLGHRNILSHNPTEDEWKYLFYECQRQSVVGLVMDALDVLSRRGQKLPSNLLFEWIGMSEQVRQQNKILNQRCVDISKLLAKAGYKSCILKGQGNARMYPDPLARQSGDIDVWVDGSKDKIISFVRSTYPEAAIQSHHIEYPVFDDVEVELHYMPTFSIVGLYQGNLGQFIEEEKVSQFDNPVSLPGAEGLVNVPTDYFNVIYQLSHMQCHFFNGGIGLRQIIDFYYLLKNAQNIKRKEELEQIIKEVGLYRYAQAVSWVLKDVLGLNEERLITEPDKKRGELLFDEIMKGGNFGQYDQRVSKKLSCMSTTLSIVARNFKLMWLFPEEAISAPINGVIRRLRK